MKLINLKTWEAGLMAVVEECCHPNILEKYSVQQQDRNVDMAEGESCIFFIINSLIQDGFASTTMWFSSTNKSLETIFTFIINIM